MKNIHRILVAALVCAASVASAQTVEGTSYYLPKTALQLTLLVEKTTYQPGEFAAYAQRYMKKNDVQLESSTTYRLIDTKMATFALPSMPREKPLKNLRNSWLR